MVERFFRDSTTERLRCGVFTQAAEMVAAVGACVACVAHHNFNPKQFIRTKSDILQTIIRANSRLRSKQNAPLRWLVPQFKEWSR